MAPSSLKRKRDESDEDYFSMDSDFKFNHSGSSGSELDDSEERLNPAPKRGSIKDLVGKRMKRPDETDPELSQDGSSGDERLLLETPEVQDDDMSDVSSSSSVGHNVGKEGSDSRRDNFFAPQSSNGSVSRKSFQDMHLSRAMLKAISSVGFKDPTPIQARAIPIALEGKDVVGGAKTGSGKTAAFLIPILERLVHRPNKVPTTRVVILMPTRELAIQCHNVATKLARFTDITFARIIGGSGSGPRKEQENQLKQRPDVIIATPGRFIDFLQNSSTLKVHAIEILVLDEADKMLQDGFADELNEILEKLPKARQTMLFSATMTESIDQLIRVGMNQPVRLMVDEKQLTVATLVQEFVRLREKHEKQRIAFLVELCKSTHTNRTIIFFRKKADVHRTLILFLLLDLRAVELHGNLKQQERIDNIEEFRSGKADFLLATDVASRGLDIQRVRSVINFEAPQTLDIYLHRVGRTARAGRAGRACTIVSETDRKIVKDAVKIGKKQGAGVVRRSLDHGKVAFWTSKLAELEPEVLAVLKEEKEQSQLERVQMEIDKGENLITHHDEIMSRPKATWFQTEKQKQQAKVAGRMELNGESEKPKSKKTAKSKLSNKEKKKLQARDERKAGQSVKGSKKSLLAKRADYLKSAEKREKRKKK